MKGVVAFIPVVGALFVGCAARNALAPEPPRRQVRLSAGERSPELMELQHSAVPSPDPVEGVVVAEAAAQPMDDLDPPPSAIFTGERAPGFTVELLIGGSGLMIVRCAGCWMAVDGDRGGQTATYIDASAGVSRARGEWLVERPGGHALLRRRDAWVDPKTRGARLIETRDIELTRVSPRSVPTPVYAVHRGDAVLAVAATPGKWEWGEGDDFTGATSCDLMEFELSPEPGAGWSSPMLLRGPLPDAAAAGGAADDGPLGIEIQAFQAAIAAPVRVRVRPRTP